MARKGLEVFTERCKVLRLFFSCRGEPLARPAAGIPTRVSPAVETGFRRQGQLPGCISLIAAGSPARGSPPPPLCMFHLGAAKP